VATAVPLIAQHPDPSQILRATRESLGGEKKLASVTSFSATGRTRQLRGNNLVPIEFELTVVLPDKYLRIDEFPAQDADPTTQGFAGDTLLQFPPPAGRGAAPPPQARLTNVKQDFARLTLALFAASFPSYPLAFTYVAEGDAPEGKADILGVAGPDNFSAQLVIQRDTHLPVMLMWQVPGRGQTAPADTRLYYGDFHDVDGVKWPFRLRRAVAGQTIEETTFDRFRINPKIDPKKFEVSK
jgi:hypothetical protein